MKRVTGLRLDVAPEERFATPEKTWAVFLDALRAGDRAAALASCTPRMRYRFEPGLRSMSTDKMKEMAARFGDLHPGTRPGDVRREYGVTLRAGSERVDGEVIFMKTLGAWLIEGLM